MVDVYRCFTELCGLVCVDCFALGYSCVYREPTGGPLSYDMYPPPHMIALLLSIRVYTGSQRAGLSYDMYPPPHMMYTGSQRSGLKGASPAGTPMNSAADHLYGTYMGHMIYMGPSGAQGRFSGRYTATQRSNNSVTFGGPNMYPPPHMTCILLLI